MGLDEDYDTTAPKHFAGFGSLAVEGFGSVSIENRALHSGVSILRFITLGPQ